MATDLNDSASWGSQNMKPENNEIIDATWGQKVAENTAFNFFAPKHLISIQCHDYGKTVDIDPYGTNWFVKHPGMNTIHGKMWGTQVTSLSAIQIGFDGTQVVNETGVDMGTTITWDASNLTEGNIYEMYTQFQRPVVSDNTCSFTFSCWGTWV